MKDQIGHLAGSLAEGASPPTADDVHSIGALAEGALRAPTVDAASAQHTPGPWVIPNGSPVVVIAPGKCDICELSGVASNPGVMADARLIAAAPDLLAALHYIKAYLEERTDWPDTLPLIGDIGAFIAKATDAATSAPRVDASFAHRGPA